MLLTVFTVFSLIACQGREGDSPEITTTVSETEEATDIVLDTSEVTTAKSSKNISVNGSEIKFAAPIMLKLIANNSEDEDGITGGFNNLTESDVTSVKAYKSGNNVVIEMVMREQISGAAEGELDGTVGDISVVTKQLIDLFCTKRNF